MYTPNKLKEESIDNIKNKEKPTIIGNSTKFILFKAEYFTKYSKVSNKKIAVHKIKKLLRHRV